MAVLGLAAICSGQALAKPPVASTTDYIYVSNYGSNTSSVIDVSTNTVTATVIKIGMWPGQIVANKDGSRVYVIVRNGISVVDTQTNMRITTIDTGATPTAIVVSPDGSRLYAATQTYRLKIIDTATNEILADETIPDYQFCYHMAISPDGRTLYLPLVGNSKLYAYDLLTRGKTSLPVTRGAGNVVVSEDGTQLFYADGYNVTVLRLSDNTVVRALHVDIADWIPYQIAQKPGTSLLYVTNYDFNTVTVIDSANGAVVTTIDVWHNPMDIAFESSGRYAYVTNEGDDRVTIIDTSTNIVHDNVDVGDRPQFIAVAKKGTSDTGLILPTLTPGYATLYPSYGTPTPTTMATGMPVTPTPTETPAIEPTAEPTSEPVTEMPTAEPGIEPTPGTVDGKSGICGVCQSMIVAPLLIIGITMYGNLRRKKK